MEMDREKLSAKEKEILEGNFRKGVALLDEKDPEWWKLKGVDCQEPELVRNGFDEDVELPRFDIHPELLVMASCYSCMLGQRFGNYTRGKILLGILTPGYEYGFDVDNHVYASAVTQLVYLEKLWVGEIINRRKGVPA